MEPAREKNEFRFVCAALLIGTFAAYFSLLRAGFINYDDLDYVINNQHVKSGLTPGNVGWAFTTGHASNWHPLTWLSLMLDSTLFGIRPGWFHLTNLLLHAANSLLLLAALKKMTGALWRSAFVAALFAWHPLHVESVAWIAERKDVLSGFFWLLTMLFYLRYVEAANAKSPEAKKQYGLALLFFACGLMSKPMVVTLPFVLLLMDWWPLKRIAKRGSAVVKSTMADAVRSAEPETAPGSQTGLPLAGALLEKFPFFVLALISSVVTFEAQRAGGAVAPLQIIPLTERIPNALVSYVEYLRKMFWPDGLAVFYPFQHHLAAWQWAGAAILLAAISGLAIALLKKRPYVAVGWFWYVGTLVPVIGLVQVGEQALADRYTYLPLIGVFIILAWGAADLTQGWPGRSAVLNTAAAATLIACLFLTATQAGYWKNSMMLFTHALAVTKDNAVAYANIGQALDAQGKVQEAKVEFMKALQIDSGSPRILNSLGVLSAHEGDTAKAIEYFNAALQKQPAYSDAHYELGNVLAGQGKYAEAADHYAAAIRAKPDYADAYNNLGAMYVQLGKPDKAVEEFKLALNHDPELMEAHAQLGGVLLRLGFPAAARPHYEEAVRLKPDSVPSRIGYGLVLAQNGELDAAISQFLAAVKLEPANAAAYHNLGLAYAARGKADEAIRAYRQALSLRPDWPAALRDLAWLLATNPRPAIRNGEEAVKLAERANALAQKPDARFLEALDAAYAEAGRFDEAVKTAEKVRQLAAAAKQKPIADRAAQRIALYKAGKPYHEPAP